MIIIYPISRGWFTTRLALAVAITLAVSPIGAQALASRQPIPKVTVGLFKANGQDKATLDGRTGILRVEIELAPGWHINSIKPLDDFLVPTSLAAESGSYQFGPQRWPRPDSVLSQAMSGYMSLYSGKFVVDMDIAPRKPQVASGPTRVTLHYQACDNSTCYPPKSVSVEL